MEVTIIHKEYSVTSNVNVSNYTVTSISNFPEGSYIADLSGNAKKKLHLVVMNILKL